MPDSRYAAFLRGINLGARNKVAMPRLRLTAERLGYDNVSTYINSGNLVFHTTGGAIEQALADELQHAITAEFGLSIDVAVRTASHLRELLDANPFPDGDPSQVVVAFLVGQPPPDAEQRVAAVADAPFRFAGSEVWINYTQGQAGSRMAAQFSTVIGASTTVRNVRTVTRTLALLER